jgi:polyhydroxybutyrate depolymerase
MMRARCIGVLALLVGGCYGGRGSDESGGLEGSDTTSGSSTSTTQEPADSSMSTGPAPTSSTSTSTSADSESGVDPDSSSSTTEGEPVGSPGCTASESLAEGEHQFNLDGYDRRYILRLPQGYSSERPWPLIFALHGNGGNPGYWDAIGGDRDIRTAFADDAIIIIPEAIDNQWRDYNAPSNTWPARIELELDYFDTIYQAAREQLCIDDAHVFSMGFSGGGSFSGVLGCRRDYIRAIAVGGSVIYFDPNECTATPAAWITIGDGELTAGREAFRDFFRMLAGCQETSTPGEPAGCIDYQGCGADTPVTFCSHPAGHVWPSIGTAATKAFFERFYAAQ